MSRFQPVRRTTLTAAAGLAVATILCGTAALRSDTPGARSLDPLRLPLLFEANAGQTQADVAFIGRAPGYTLFLKGDEAVFRLKSVDPHARKPLRERAFDRPSPGTASRFSDRTPGRVVSLRLAGASAGRPAGSEREPTRISYLREGSGPLQPAAYRRAAFRSVYPGVDVVYYGNAGQVEYDFVVAPGSDPGQVRLRPAGADDVSLDNTGRLRLKAGDETLVMDRPIAYQDGPAGRSPVASSYVLDESAGEVRFQVGPYDSSRELVIDPIVRFSSLFGGSGMDSGLAVAMDAQRNTYVAGYTESVDFPGASGANRGDGDAFVMKVRADGAQVVYTAYLGGTGIDAALGITVDAANRAIVTGMTDSADFPTAAAEQAALGGELDAFVSRLNAAGTALEYSTYLGGTGSDGGSRVAVDATGRAYLTGFTNSEDFPVSGTAFQPAMGGDYDAFVTGLAADGTLFASTYLGGTDGDSGSGVQVYLDGTVYVGGSSDSGNFPTTPDTFRPDFRGGRFGDAFVVRLQPDLSTQIFGTYVGGSGSDSGAGIGIDSDGNVLIGGTTDSRDLMVAIPPVLPHHGILQGGTDAYVCKLDGLGRFFYISYIGSHQDDVVRAVALDVDPHPVSKAYLFGETDGGPTWPQVDPLMPMNPLASTLFLAKVHEHLFLVQPQLMIDYSTQIGGFGEVTAGDMAIDGIGNVALTGEVYGPDFPVWLPFDNRRVSGSNSQGFVMRMDDGVYNPGGRLVGGGRIAFGTVRVGTLATREVVLRNTHRTSPLAVKISQPRNLALGLSNSLLAVVIPPQGQHKFQVRYLPANTTPVADTIRIYTSDPVRPSIAINITGVGRASTTGGGSARP